MYGRMPVGGLADHNRVDRRGAILFLSRRGAGRALLAEAIVNRHSAGGFTAVSAGVAPENAPTSAVEELMRAYSLPTRAPRSVEAALESAPRVDYVIALWDRAAGEAYPDAAGRPVAASWDVPDFDRLIEDRSGLVAGRASLVRAYLGLRQRIVDFIQAVQSERLRQAERSDDILFGEGEPLRIGGAALLNAARFSGASERAEHDVLDLSQAMLLGRRYDQRSDAP
ncbi:MAG: hypothetical protein AAGM38_03210 [Pseudomonadota bacterium]